MNLKHFNFKHIKLNEIGSTNSYLQDLNNVAKQGCGTIVSVTNQTNGRGQKGNEWKVEPGENLTFSIVVYPKILAKHVFYLNIIASLAVQKTLADLNIASIIKWPNDILVNEKKICGILVENQVNGNEISQSIIGIGLNVSQLTFNNTFKATSIKKEGIDIDAGTVLEQLYGYLDFYYNLLLESNFNLLLKHYYMHLFWFEKEGFFEDKTHQFKAKVLGVTEIGMLNLQLEKGSKKSFDIKEIKFVY